MSMVPSGDMQPVDDFPPDVPVTDGKVNYCNISCALSAGKTKNQVSIIPFAKRRTVIDTKGDPIYGGATETSMRKDIGFCGFCGSLI